MEAGEVVAKVADLDDKPRQAILDELKAVMSAYNARDGGASCKIE